MNIKALTLELHHEILDRAEALRPLPSTVIRLASVVADPESDVDDVVAVLRGDPGLVAALLKEANSAMSGPAAAIGTIEAAVTRLGSGRVLALATGAALDLDTPVHLDGYDVASSELRSHAIHASFVAEAIQFLVKDRVGPEVITATFLHDIGKIVLNPHLDARLFAAIRADHGTLAAERELAEVDHAELGALLMELWQIPRPIIDAIRHHHEPDRAVEPGAWVVCVADALSHRMSQASWPCSTPPETVAWALEALGLTEEQVTDRSEKALRRAGLID